MISLVERGHLANGSLPLLRLILAALDASLVIEVRWPTGALERLLDEDHATVVARVADVFRLAGWEVPVEVTHSEWGERGSIDLLAYHAGSGTVLVVEVKTDLPSAEATLRKLDEKVRLAPKIARVRLGWHGRAGGGICAAAPRMGGPGDSAHAGRRSPLYAPNLSTRPGVGRPRRCDRDWA